MRNTALSTHDSTERWMGESGLLASVSIQRTRPGEPPAPRPRVRWLGVRGACREPPNRRELDRRGRSDATIAGKPWCAPGGSTARRCLPIPIPASPIARTRYLNWPGHPSRIHFGCDARPINESLQLEPRILGRGPFLRGMASSRHDVSHMIGRLAMILAALAVAQPSCGQAIMGPEDVLAPKLILNGAGHTGPLRAMIYSPDGKALLSTGLDKIVHIWEVGERGLRLDRTIRPPIQRRGGVIYAMALSRDADERGQRLLAIAGLTLIGSGGRILVYRFPGRNDTGTGDWPSISLRVMTRGNRFPNKPVIPRRSSVCHSRSTGVSGIVR